MKILLTLGTLLVMGTKMYAYDTPIFFNSLAIHPTNHRTQELSRSFMLNRKSDWGANFRFGSYSQNSMDASEYYHSPDIHVAELRYDQKMYGILRGLSVQTSINFALGASHLRDKNAAKLQSESTANLFPSIALEWIAIDNHRVRLTTYLFGQFDLLYAAIAKSNFYRASVGDAAHAAGFGTDLVIKCVNTKNNYLTLNLSGRAQEAFGGQKIRCYFVDPSRPTLDPSGFFGRRRDNFHLGASAGLDYRHKLFFIDLQSWYDYSTDMKVRDIKNLAAVAAANPLVAINGALVKPVVVGESLKLRGQHLVTTEIRCGFENALTNGKFLKNDSFGVALGTRYITPNLHKRDDVEVYVGAFFKGTF